MQSERKSDWTMIKIGAMRFLGLLIAVVWLPIWVLHLVLSRLFDATWIDED